MNIRPENVKNAMDDVIERYHPEPLPGKITHAEHVSLAEYVITRDVLVELDVNFKQAEKLARDHAGPAWERVQRCLEHLK